MSHYRVLIDRGWPLAAATHKFGEIFESNDPRCEEDVIHGYLERTSDEVTPESPTDELPPEADDEAPEEF